MADTARYDGVIFLDRPVLLTERRAGVRYSVSRLPPQDERALVYLRPVARTWRERHEVLGAPPMRGITEIRALPDHALAGSPDGVALLTRAVAEGVAVRNFFAADAVDGVDAHAVLRRAVIERIDDRTVGVRLTVEGGVA